MNDYIRREDALKGAHDIVVEQKSGYKYRHRCIDPQYIRELPAADVEERKTGKWRHYENNLTCSECGDVFYDDIMDYCGDEVPHYCPNCGAKMEEIK